MDSTIKTILNKGTNSIIKDIQEISVIMAYEIQELVMKGLGCAVIAFVSTSS